MGAFYVRRQLIPAAIATLFALAIQLVVFSGLRFAGVVIMFVWLWPVAMGIAGYTLLSLIVGLGAGVFFDLHSVTPFGLTAAVGMLLGYAASRLGREGVGDLDSAAWWVAPVIAASAGFVAPLGYTLAGFFALDFQLWRGSVLAMMVVNATAFFILARPVVRVARSIGRLGEGVIR